MYLLITISVLSLVRLHAIEANPVTTSINFPILRGENSLLDDKIRNVLIKLNRDFKTQEEFNPAKGYCVQIETKPFLQATLTPFGGNRIEEELSGTPKNTFDYIKKCPFCDYPRQNLKDPRIIKVFADQSYAALSLSHQILLIPSHHYSHWFEIPLETQIKLLYNILEIRNIYSSSVLGPIEFHCGSSAGQTVFHFHGRTGVYLHPN